MGSLRIGVAELDAIRRRASEGAPDEVCGVLVGRRQDASIEVRRVVHTRNAHDNPRTEYLIHPAELMRITLEAEDDWGLEVVGFYHSHPRGPPHLSVRDHARATWTGAAYLLVWTQDGASGVGCWAWDAAEAAFVPLRIVEEPEAAA